MKTEKEIKEKLKQLSNTRNSDSIQENREWCRIQIDILKWVLQ